MRSWLVAASSLLALGAITALVIETHRLAELVGVGEIQVRDLQHRLAAATRELAAAPEAPPAPAAAPTDRGVDALAYANLRLELTSVKAQLQAVTETLQRRNEEQMLKAKASEELAKLREPMPEGVRICLNALQAWMHVEGFTAQRFLRATSLEPDGLHGVEMLDTEVDGLAVAFVQADRMTATLDRGASRLELRFFDGFRTVGGERTAFPKDGLSMTFRDVDGHVVEQRLPFLVQAVGVYATKDEPTRPSTDVDPVTRRQWLERLEQVLDGAGTELTWQPSRFRGMDGGWFLTVDLIGTDAKHEVLGGVHCERMAIEVDNKAGVVSLLLQNGSLRRDGIESSITGEGLRMLLPKLTPKQATDAMLGMVVIR